MLKMGGEGGRFPFPGLSPLTLAPCLFRSIDLCSLQVLSRFRGGIPVFVFSCGHPSLGCVPSNLIYRFHPRLFGTTEREGVGDP